MQPQGGTRLSTQPAPRILKVITDEVRIVLGGAQTGGGFAVVENVSQPGSGPPPHVHRNEDEGFFVVEGDVDFLLGDRWVRVAPGSSAFGKRGIPHTFRNAGTTPCRVVAVIQPAGFEEFFVEVDRLCAVGMPAPEQIMALGRRYGVEFLPPG